LAEVLDLMFEAMTVPPACGERCYVNATFTADSGSSCPKQR